MGPERAGRRLREDDGSGGGLALVALLGAVALMFVLGLVVDGGARLSAADRANRIAMEAARAGAQVLTAQVVTGSVDQAVQEYLAVEGVTGTATVTGDRVDVTVEFTQPTRLLSMIGIDDFQVHGSGFAYALFTDPAGAP